MNNKNLLNNNNSSVINFVNAAQCLRNIDEERQKLEAMYFGSDFKDLLHEFDLMMARLCKVVGYDACDELVHFDFDEKEDSGSNE